MRWGVGYAITDWQEMVCWLRHCRLAEDAVLAAPLEFDRRWCRGFAIADWQEIVCWLRNCSMARDGAWMRDCRMLGDSGLGDPLQARSKRRVAAALSLCHEMVRYLCHFRMSGRVGLVAQLMHGTSSCFGSAIAGWQIERCLRPCSLALDGTLAVPFQGVRRWGVGCPIGG